MKLKDNILLILFIFCLVPLLVSGQQHKKNVTITGNIGLYGDFYHMDCDTPGAIAPRRPGTLIRLVVNATLNFRNFSLPITMSIPSGQYSVIVPNLPEYSNDFFKNYKAVFTNPLNRFGVAPKYKWFQLLLGSQIPNYSELSVGDLSVFGAGISLTPGKFRFSCFAGTSQHAFEEDTANNIQGMYARKIYSAKIGYGHEDSSHIYLTGSMMEDDTSSLTVKPVNLMPQIGILTSIDFRINVAKKAYIKGEVAGSAFTRDMRSNEMVSFTPSLPDGIFTERESSRMDYAALLCAGSDWKNFGIKTTGRYFGDGFVSMGYPYMQTDRFEVTIDPRLSLLNNKIQLSGSAGRRVNNLSESRAATTTQTLAAANLNIQFLDNLSLAASYSNFGFRNSIVNDTFKIEMVTMSWSISPTLNISAKKSIHMLTFLFSQNIFNDFNTISGALNGNDANNAVLSYSVSILKRPFTIGTFFSYFDNKTSFGRITSNSIGLNAGYKFFKKKLVTSAGVNISDNKADGISSGFQISPYIGVKYTLKKKISFSIYGSLNQYDYRESRPGISFRENLLRVAITYKF